MVHPLAALHAHEHVHVIVTVLGNQVYDVARHVAAAVNMPVGDIVELVLGHHPHRQHPCGIGDFLGEIGLEIADEFSPRPPSRLRTRDVLKIL